MKPIRVLAICLAAILALPSAASAQEVTFQQYNFAFTPPAGWQRLPNLPSQPQLVALYANPAKTAQLMVIVNDEGTSPIVMNDSFVNDFTKGVEDGGGGKVLSGSFVQAAGVKSYQMVGAMSPPGGKAHITTFGVAIPAGKTLYGLQAMRTDGAASDLPELRKSIDSFRFLTAPPPQPADDGTFSAHNFGGATGHVLFYCVVVAVIFGIIRMLRGRR